MCIRDSSRALRNDYLARMDAARQAGPYRYKLSCGNQAHGFAASGDDKPALRYGQGGNCLLYTSRCV